MFKIKRIKDRFLQIIVPSTVMNDTISVCINKTFKTHKT